MAQSFPKALATLKVVFEGTSADEEGGKSLVVTVRPKSFTVSRNGYKEADTFEMEFDAKALPFSPDIIRGAAVEIIGWNSDELYPSADSERRAVADPANRLIVGLVDEATIHFDGGGRFFRLSGRDYTALMIDRQWNPKVRVPVGKQLKDTVQLLVDIAVGVLNVDDNGITSPTGLKSVLTVRLADGVDDGSTSTADAVNPTGQKQKVSKRGKVKAPTTGSSYAHTNKKGIPVTSGPNFWDVIYRTVINHGLIVYVDGTDVVISHPNVLTNTVKDKATHVAYGRNLTSLSIERKLGKETVPQIKVVSYDPKTRQAISAVWPENPTQKTTGIGTKKDEVQVTVALNITDKARLLDLAKLRYAALARAEATYHFETKELEDLDGNSLLRLHAGDAIRVDFDDLHVEDFKTFNSTAQRRSAMVALGYSNTIASTVASAFDYIAREKAFFYVKEVAIAFDVDSGYSLNVTALNYVIPSRDDVQ